MVQVQRYEGASNIFGPHALSAYLDQYGKLTRGMFQVSTLILLRRMLVDDG